MHLCQVRAHKITEINVDGMLPKESPETLTVTCSQYYGIAFAMTRTAYSATLEKIEVCVCMSCGPSLAPEILKLICSSLLGVALQL